MTVEQTTPNQGYPLPYSGNDILDDVGRLRAALEAIDNDVATLLSLLAAKAGLDAPNFEGIPTADTPLPGDNSSKLANTAWVVDAIGELALLPSLLQTVANKTLLTNNAFADVTDDTKKLALVLSAITAGVTRTLTMPDEDVNLGALGAHLAFRRANILGTVSQAGGVPTGGVIEHSEGTPDGGGDYIDLVRFADGTQIVRGRKTLVRSSTTLMAAIINFPKNFVDGDYSVALNYRPASNGSAPNSYASDCTLTGRDLLHPVAGIKAVASVDVGAQAIAGAGTFGSGDKLYIDFTITGRWF